MAKKTAPKKLVIYLTAGYPDIASTEKIAAAAISGGADIIELGVPFSDPAADGKTIQFSSREALSRGVTLAQIISLAGRLKKYAAPVYLMSYLNPLFAYGIRKLERDAAKAGVAGFIIPDLTFDAARALEKKGVPVPEKTVYLAAPNSSPSRMSAITRASRGFIYAVSLLGVTGLRKKNARLVPGFLKRLEHAAGGRLPVYAGFGIATPKQAREMSRFSDGVIIGSAIIEIIRRVPRETAAAAVKKFVASCKRSLIQSGGKR